MQIKRAFIVRPFGTQEGIDFERVEKELFDRALTALGIKGRTTGEIARQGNIREDMFRLLVVSDLVIADVTIHNANVFYELGVRHGLRHRHTVLVRARDAKHKYPFDLQTDRYFQYNIERPEEDLDAFLAVLRASLAAPAKDSPVFQLLPRLKPHDRDTLVVVPRGFQDEVSRAKVGGRRGDLRLLAEEAHGFEWGSSGLRLVGDAQFDIKAYSGAKETFLALQRLDEDDFHANYRLGTLFQKLASEESDPDAKLDYVARSEQAIRNALERTVPEGDDTRSAVERRADCAEGNSLLGSNAKTRWLQDWQHLAAETRRAPALRSPHLANAIAFYGEGYAQNLDSHYAGINTLAMLKLQTELARALPAVWAERFDDDDIALAELKKREQRAARITAALELVFSVDDAQTGRDRWKQISRADLLFLTQDKPGRIANAYRDALAGADPFVTDAARRNVLIFRDLGLWTEKVEAALAEMQAAPVVHALPQRVVLFTGHMIDLPDHPKDTARFPPTASAEAKARALIEQALRNEMAQEGGVTLGIAGGACGGDILFHEVCEELGVRTQLLLALPVNEFQVASVSRAGPRWVERYRRLAEKLQRRVMADSKELPNWLVEKNDYDFWQRHSFWLMFSALAENAKHLTLLALYNRARDPDGPGGTAHLVEEAAKRGFKVIELDASELLEG